MRSIKGWGRGKNFAQFIKDMEHFLAQLLVILVTLLCLENQGEFVAERGEIRTCLGCWTKTIETHERHHIDIVEPDMIIGEFDIDATGEAGINSIETTKDLMQRNIN